MRGRGGGRAPGAGGAGAEAAEPKRLTPWAEFDPLAGWAGGAESELAPFCRVLRYGGLPLQLALLQSQEKIKFFPLGKKVERIVVKI